MLLLKKNIISALLIVLPSLSSVGQVAVNDSAKTQSRQVLSQLKFTVHGKVVDLSTGNTFTGAKVSLVNNPVSVLTNEDGTFELKVPDLNSILKIEAAGFQTQFYALKGSSDITIKMLEATTVASIYDEPILKGATEVSVRNIGQNYLTINEMIPSSLAGQVYGINNSGITGNASTLFLRGINSLNTSAQPLYVVDGVIWQSVEDNSSVFAGYFVNPLALIDPNDVESISILKNGTTMYGSKGANGVIFINTKRAHSQVTEISASLTGGYKAAFSTIPVMDAEQYRLYASDIASGMYPNSSAVDRLRFLDDDKTKSYYNANHNKTNWQDLINKGAFAQNYGISVKGGGETALINFSLGYLKSDGNIKGSKFDRYNVRFNSDLKLTDRLNVAMDVAFAQSSNNLYNDGIDSISSPYFLALIKSPLYNPYLFNNNGKLSGRLSDVDELRTGNPLSLIESGNGLSRQYGLNASVRSGYDLIKEKLTFNLLFSYRWNRLHEGAFVPDYGVTDQLLKNDLGEVYATAKNLVKDRMDSQSSIMWDGSLRWKIVSDFNNELSVSGGCNYLSDVYDLHNAYGYNTGSDNMTQLSNTTSSLRGSNGLNDNKKSISLYSNAEYVLRSKYILNAIVAMDASSRFGSHSGDFTMGNAPWTVFPSVSAAWLVSSERFMKSLSFINYLKLGGGYGLSGNDNLPTYASRTYFSSVRYSENAYGLVLTNIGNENLKWETTALANATLDLSMFNNRWATRAEFFQSKTSDLLINKPLNDVAGLSYYFTNGGELENKGFNVATNIRILNGKNWKLDAGASIGHYKNKVLSLIDGGFTTNVLDAQILTTEGSSAGVFYGYKALGVFSTSSEAESADLHIQDVTGKLIPFEAGDMHFEDLNGDHIINEKDRQVIGNPNPNFYGNFTLNVAYGNFNLGALFTYVQGNDIYNALRANLESGETIYNQSTAMQNRWVANGQTTSIPRATYGDPMGNARFSDRWIEDGSYLKFKSLTLSYKVPLQSTYIHGFNVWASANNIFTSTKYLGADPEVSYGNSVLYQGLDAGLIPQSFTFYLGLNINL